MKSRILFRVDGSSKIGLGHLYRVLALIEMLNSKYQCVLVTAFVSDLVLSETSKLGVSILKVPAFEYALPDEKKDFWEIPFDMEGIVKNNDVVVVDGYWFGVKYQKSVREKGSILIYIDDLAIGEFNVDVIINHAPGTMISQYQAKVAPETKLCLGLDYLILRKAFFRKVIFSEKRAKSIYLSFGGTDYYGLSLKILNLCLFLNEKIEIHLLLSSSFNKDLINKLTELQKRNTEMVFLHQNLDGQEISDVIDRCTHAFTASSTVALEVMARGIKPLIGYCVDNQKGIYDGLTEAGLAIGAGNLLDNNSYKLKNYLESDAYSYREFNNLKLLAIWDELIPE